MKNFLLHSLTGLVLYAAINALTWGLVDLFSAGYGALSFYLIVGLPGGYALFIYLTSRFNLPISLIQYLVTGFGSFAAIGTAEPLYHDLVYYSDLGEILEVAITTTIGLLILVVIKILSDLALQAMKYKTREPNVNRVLQSHYQPSYSRKNEKH